MDVCAGVSVRRSSVCVNTLRNMRVCLCMCLKIYSKIYLLQLESLYTLHTLHFTENCGNVVGFRDERLKAIYTGSDAGKFRDGIIQTDKVHLIEKLSFLSRYCFNRILLPESLKIKCWHVCVCVDFCSDCSLLSTSSLIIIICVLLFNSNSLVLPCNQSKWYDCAGEDQHHIIHFKIIYLYYIFYPNELVFSWCVCVYVNIVYIFNSE